MKTSSVAVLSTALAAASAAAAASTEPVAWWDPIRNVTCTGSADGHITCQAGEVEALLKPHDKLDTNTATPTTALHTLPLAQGGAQGAQEVHKAQGARRAGGEKSAAQALQTRADDAAAITCSGDGQARSLGCFTSCLAQGFCVAVCDAESVCRCSCKDGAVAGGVVCSAGTAAKC
ncbi:e839cdec-b440-45e8-a1ea-1a8c07e7e9ad [Thermothielavioides terrestris]|uniref:E839cdec-b440-45e8-a1ea-1a8c07e7e9ad n=1 Tax=Thermothielavioides terrestris TaxID=2587410 RepID=A0A446BQU7_9PEZI|nr:e839cdec-b440-45e8-a1ea-1a8c07e7e9ad [Thermothielavioides terrestris]